MPLEPFPPPAPAQVDALPASLPVVASEQSWEPPFQMFVDDAWVYFARCSTAAAGCEVGRAPVDGGRKESLATGRTNAFAVDSERLYVFESRELVSLDLDGGLRRTLTQAEGIPLQLGVAGKHVFWSEANPPSFCFVDGDGEGKTQLYENVQIPTLFAVQPEEVFVVDGSRETGRLELSRLAVDPSDRGVRMRVDQLGAVPSSLRVAGPLLYWASMDRAGNSHLWSAPRVFTRETRPIQIPANGLGLGVHDLGLQGPTLYFLDSKGAARIPIAGGEVQRLGPVASALAAGAGGVFIGLLDGGIQRLDER